MRISYVSLVVQALFCCKRACDLVADRVLHCVFVFFLPFSRVWAIVFWSSVFSVHTLLFFRCQFDSVLILIRIPSFLINIQYASVCLYKVFTSIRKLFLYYCYVRNLRHIREAHCLAVMKEKQRKSTHPIPYIPSIHLSIQIQFRTYYVITYFQFSRKMKIKTAFALSLASSLSLVLNVAIIIVFVFIFLFLLFHFTYIYRECDVIWWDRYMNVVRILMIHNVRLSYLHPYFNMPLFI